MNRVPEKTKEYLTQLLLESEDHDAIDRKRLKKDLEKLQKQNRDQ